MKSKMRKIGKSIKETTIIGWIRFSNFVKDHKLIASFIGLFVVSGIIAFVVFAATNEEISRVNVDISAVKVSDVASTNDITSIDSFSTIKYDVTYTYTPPTAGNTPQKIVISATFSGCDDCYWVNLAGNDNYGTISSSEETYSELVSPNNLTTSTSANSTTTKNATFYLKVGNVKNGTEITAKFDGGNGVVDKTISVTNSKSSSPQSLSLQLLDGSSYKDSACTNGRCTAFGILLGVEGSGDTSPSLKGMYFNPEQSIFVEAYNGPKDSENTSIPLLENASYFGLYDSSKKLIDGMPNYKESDTQNSYVYDSGSVVSLTQTAFSSSATATSSKSYTLLGSDDITLAVGDTYIDQGISNSPSDSAFCKIGSPTNCTISILKNGTAWFNTIDTTTSGTKYRINYTIKENNITTLLSRYITVGDTQKDDATNKATSVVEVSNASILVNKTDTSLIAKVGSKDIVCDGANHDGLTCKVTGLDSSKVGDQNVTYTVTDANGFVTTIPSTVHVGYMYELKVKDFKTGPNYYSYKDANGNNFVAFGAYYVTANSNSGDNIYTKLTSQGVESGSVLNPTVSNGTKTETLSFLNADDETSLTDKDSLAYGEETILDSKFEYSGDADNPLTSLTVTIPLTDQFTLENYSEEATSENFYYVGAPDNAVITATTNDSKTTVTYTLKSGQINPGDTIDFKIKVKVNNTNSGGKASITPTVTCSNQEALTVTGSSINITTFKSRIKMYVDETENVQKSEALIDGANKTSSTVTMYPSLSLPAEQVDTNAVGIGAANVTIKVTLPKGINYVYNDDYLRPFNVSTNSSGQTVITYYLKNKAMNTWIDPINFDISYDVSLETGKSYDITSVIEATDVTTGTISDASLEDARTATAIINYINTEDISYGEYTAHSAIAQNKAFTITDKLYNHGNSALSNLSIITILPSDSYTGTYTITPEASTFCTKDTNITTDNLSNINWVSCASLNNNYTGVTAIKTPSISLASKAESDHSFTITPSGNKTGDKYTIKSYLMGVDNATKEIPATTITVVSKRITGYVWEDFDANGLNDTGEKMVGDVTLSLYKTSDKSLVDTTTSSADGKYEFANLSEGTYYIVPTFNTSKYGLSPASVTDDPKTTSSFSKTRDNNTVISTDDLVVDANTRSISNINLGLSLRQIYTVKVSKYVTKAVITNALGVSSTTDFGNVTLAKLNVRDPSNVSIKVIYTIELENTGYYPGYVYDVKDYIPDGMTFNKDYAENKDWSQNSDGYLENKSLTNTLINAGDKKYLLIAFDISRKEAGSFVNSVAVDDEDLQILTVAAEGGKQ